MTNIVLLGGNGYIGRNVCQKWLQQDPRAEFYVLSRSGKNALNDARIKNIAVDVTSLEAVEAVLPNQVDYIVDFVGHPEKDPELFKQVNDLPAKVMLELAEKYQVKAMGFIGGTLGPKDFVDGKKRIIQFLQKSAIPLTVVEPTIVYGNGRSDKLVRIVPILKFLSVFNKKLKPVHIDDVVDGFIAEIMNK